MHALLSTIHAANDMLTHYVVGTSPLGDLFYSIATLFQTGQVLEDSVFFNCMTMGNQVCG